MLEFEKKIRLFVAVDLPEPARTALADLADPKLSQVSWTRPDQIHLTLRFIDNVAASEVNAILQSLKCVRVPPFQLSVELVETFPSGHAPRVIWVGVGSSDNWLFELARRVDEALLNCQIEPEPRPFHPHLTIGRVRRTGSAGAIRRFVHKHAEFRTAPFLVSSFALYQSELSRSGAIHTPLLTIDLGEK